MDDYCHECKKKTEIIHIHSAGDTVCSECGLVLEAYSIDDTSEWRTFTDSTDDDPNRVGARINPLLEDAELVTHVSNDGAKSENFLSPRRWQNRESSSTRSLMSGFSTIDAMSDRLNLVETIKDRAKEIYKKMEDQKACRGRKQDAVLAACLYIACRQEDKPRTIKEIGSIANGATKKEIGRAKELIVKQLELEMGQTVDPGDFMKRFCSNLGMTNQMVKVAQEAVNKAKEFDIRRSPISIAAAVIYIVTRISNHDKSLKDVTVATGVAETTIRHAFKDLSPYLVKILPSGYAQEKDLNDITIP